VAARSTRLVYEIQSIPVPYAQASQLVVAALSISNPAINRAHISRFRLEALVINVEPFMPLIFPTLRGQGIEIVKRQLWSTNVKEHVSGRHVAVGNWRDPMWEWDLTFPDYLPDTGWRGRTDSDLKVVVNFVNGVQGQLTPFLYRDKDDASVVGQFLGFGTGSNVTWPLVRTLGQPDPRLITREMETQTVPASAPYAVSATYAPLFVTDYGVKYGNYASLTKTTGSPGVGQYAVSGGTYAFNAADAGKQVWLLYDHLAPLITEPIGFLDVGRPFTLYRNGTPQAASAYTIDQTNYYNQTITFGFAPSAGDVITVDMSYFHVCRLGDDVAEFTRVVDLEWSNKKITLKSIRSMAAF
jgi:hypothetical protein